MKLDSESKTQKKPKAEGYPDNTNILFKQLPVSTYMASKNPAIALQDAYEVSIDSYLCLVLPLPRILFKMKYFYLTVWVIGYCTYLIMTTSVIILLL